MTVFLNVGGRGVKLFLNTRFGNDTDITLGYRSSVVFRTYFEHTIESFYQQRNYFIYENKHKVQELDITRTGAEFAFGYQGIPAECGEGHLFKYCGTGGQRLGQQKRGFGGQFT
jgi:hypothetical protein